LLQGLSVLDLINFFFELDGHYIITDMVGADVFANSRSIWQFHPANPWARFHIFKLAPATEADPQSCRVYMPQRNLDPLINGDLARNLQSIRVTRTYAHTFPFPISTPQVSGLFSVTGRAKFTTGR